MMMMMMMMSSRRSCRSSSPVPHRRLSYLLRLSTTTTTTAASNPTRQQRSCCAPTTTTTTAPPLSCLTLLLPTMMPPFLVSVDHHGKEMDGAAAELVAASAATATTATAAVSTTTTTTTPTTKKKRSATAAKRRRRCVAQRRQRRRAANSFALCPYLPSSGSSRGMRAILLLLMLLLVATPSTFTFGVDAATTAPPTAPTSSSSSGNGNGGGGAASSTPYSEHQQQLLLEQQRQQLADAQRAVRQTLEEMKRHSTIAGSIKPVLQKLVLSETELRLLLKSVQAVAHWEDLIMILMLGWTIVPALQYPYQVLQPNESYDNSITKLLAEHVQHIGKLALLVYVVDLIKMMAIGLGLLVIDSDKWAHLPHCFAQSVYTIYGANRLVKLKKHYLRAYINRHPEVFGRAKLLNRLVDAALYGLAFVLVLGYLKVEMGVAVQSVLALGSVGTLAIGLASQGIISQILHGLLLASNARIYEGDSIQLSNGQKGTIVHLGWLETTLRGSDEVMISIPNADLLKQHVSNLSRVRYCQVTQSLHFKHKDIPKLSDLTQSIKQEIQLSCPEVIVDGSRPFRAYWTDITKEGVTVTVDAHFAIRPTVEQYWENRQRVLQAIHRACVLHQVEFHVPHLSELLHSGGNKN